MSKKALLLSQMITQYLKSKEPIGSESLKLLVDMKISSASIRNYFKLLSDEGMLFQPHISSGRIPTHSALKAHWCDCLDVGSILEINALKSLQNASFECHIFTSLSVESPNRLQGAQKVNDRLMIDFEQMSVSIPFSAPLERFLDEIKQLDIADVKKIATQVRATNLLEALRCVKSHEISRFCAGALSEAYRNNPQEKSFYDIIDGLAFDMLDSGIYYEEVVPNGYMAIMQEAKITSQPDKKARMLCVGALDRDWSYFYQAIQA